LTGGTLGPYVFPVDPNGTWRLASGKPLKKGEYLLVFRIFGVGNWDRQARRGRLHRRRQRPKTGSKTFWSEKPGFELLAKLYACVRYENGGSACAGGFTGAKVKGYYAVADLGRFKTDPVNPEKVIGSLDAPAVPFQGATLSASLSYKDLGVKPGQAIRIIARVSDGPSDETADFPEVLLTLK
jgi:hypothetical protein